VPTASNGIDAVNFRHLQESTSLHLEKGEIMAVAGAGHPVNGAPSTPGVDDGLDPMDAALFASFSNVTLHYDDETDEH
jgi:protein-serine/threonine kinase